MGLLDFLNGSTGVSDGDGYKVSRGLLDMDQRKWDQLAAFGQALAQAGAPSRTGNHWGLGMSQGFGAANQAGQAFDDRQMQNELKRIQLQQARAQAAQKETPKTILDYMAKLDPKDYTPDSVVNFQRSLQGGKPEAGLLVPRVKKDIAPSGEVVDLYNADTTKNYGAVRDVNMGGSMAFMNPAGQMKFSMPRSQSPESMASNYITMRGQDMTDARAKEGNAIQREAQRTQIMETPAGPIAIDKGLGTAKPVMMGNEPAKGDSALKRESSSNRALVVANEAEKILTTQKPTGSILGTGADWAGSVVGYSTSGAQSAKQLAALAGQLTSEMPRMEGPQSNYDVALYQQMAGDVGNSMLPIKTRLAALQTVKDLAKKYATPSAQDAPSKQVRVVDW